MKKKKDKIKTKKCDVCGRKVRKRELKKVDNVGLSFTYTPLTVVSACAKCREQPPEPDMEWFAKENAKIDQELGLEP